MGVPENRWFLMDNPIDMDDLKVPPLLETSIYITFAMMIIMIIRGSTRLYEKYGPRRKG